MSKHASSSSTSYGAWALAAWLAALALFLIWLGWVLFSTSPIEGKAEKPSLPGVAQSDLGTVLDTLPAKGSLTTPNMPFTASQEYVLTGAGLQGFYQTSAPNDVWTLSYPEPQLNAQVIKRGPPVPEIVTQGVDVPGSSWPKAPPCWLFLPASAVPSATRTPGRPFWKCTTATSPPTLWKSTRKVRSLPADPAMSA